MPTAVEYLLRIDGITPPTGAGIPIEAYSLNVVVAHSEPDGGGESAKVTFNPFSITRKVDRSSPRLLQAAVTGQHLSSVVLTLFPAGQKSGPTIYTLGDVLITEISEAGNVHGGVAPLEQVQFSFLSLKMTVDGVKFPPQSQP